VEAVLAVLRVGEAGKEGQIAGELLAAVNAGGERANRAEGRDAIGAVDLLVDAEQHRAQHLVGDHLVEALARAAAKRVVAVARPGRRRRSVRRRRTAHRGSGTIGWGTLDIDTGDAFRGRTEPCSCRVRLCDDHRSQRNRCRMLSAFLIMVSAHTKCR
jgi:hypothetical protein